MQEARSRKEEEEDKNQIGRPYMANVQKGKARKGKHENVNVEGNGKGEQEEKTEK